MVCAATSNGEKADSTTPHSDLAGYLIERNYQSLGCNWNRRRVQLLCAKLGDTPAILAARLRIRLFEFERRMETDRWTKQDGLILTMIEREIDLLKGGVVPAGKLVS